MPRHRARRSKTRTIAAVLLLASIGVLTVRQVDLSDSGNAIDRVSSVTNDGAEQVDDAGGSADTESSETGTEQTGVDSQRVTQAPTLQRLPDPVCVPKVIEETFTVASFNIKSALSGLDRVTAAVANLDADIILLQEVDKYRATSRYVDMPAYIGSRLGMESAFGANVFRGSNRYGRSQYGTAILSKYPIKEEWNTLLPNDRRGQQRGLLHAVVDVRGLELSVYNTHLQNIYDELKMRQIRAIAPILASDERPKLFGGDMNAHPGSSVLGVAYTVLDDPWAAGVGRGSSLTHPATRPRGRIDYVLHQGEGLVPISADVMAPGVSDHRPTRATFTLTGVAGEVCKRPTVPDLSDVDAALRDAEKARRQ